MNTPAAGGRSCRQPAWDASRLAWREQTRDLASSHSPSRSKLSRKSIHSFLVLWLTIYLRICLRCHIVSTDQITEQLPEVGGTHAFQISRNMARDEGQESSREQQRVLRQHPTLLSRSLSGLRFRGACGFCMHATHFPRVSQCRPCLVSNGDINRNRG